MQSGILSIDNYKIKIYQLYLLYYQMIQPRFNSLCLKEKKKDTQARLVYKS